MKAHFKSPLYCLFSSAKKWTPYWTCPRKASDFPDEGCCICWRKGILKAAPRSRKEGTWWRGAVAPEPRVVARCQAALSSPLSLSTGPEALISVLRWLHSCKDKISYLCRHLLSLLGHVNFCFFSLSSSCILKLLNPSHLDSMMQCWVPYLPLSSKSQTLVLSWEDKILPNNTSPTAQSGVIVLLYFGSRVD